MDIKQLRFLSALARERHFARAAASCNISQPTLSARIRQLEEELGVPIVERGKRFMGLTPEGERVLDWANRILADCDALEQELSELKGGLSGRLKIGVIPSALPTVALLVSPFCAAHPGVNVTVRSLSSSEIERNIHDFELEIGLTYLDNEPLGQVRSLPLYQERYALLTAAEGPFAGRESVTWKEIADVPLCLLTEEMQNRRIVDAAFGQAGCTASPQIETNSLTGLYSHIRFGPWSSIIPRNLIALTGPHPELAAIPITAPTVSHSVGLIASGREPASPLAKAMMSAAAKIEVFADLLQV